MFDHQQTGIILITAESSHTTYQFNNMIINDIVS